MMATSLSTKTLETPSGMSIRVGYQGGATVLANGDLKRDLMDASVKLQWSLSWTNISASALSDVLSAFKDAVAGDVAFTPPDGGSYQVNAGEKPSMQYECLKTPGGLVWNVSIELFEA